MKNQKGLSLIELMISITLGLVLMAGVVQVFVSSKTVYTSQQGMSRIQETGRLAMEFIGRDLRIGSYFGCANTINSTNAAGLNYTDTLTPTIGTNTLHRNFTQGLIGYTDSTLPAGVTLATATSSLVSQSDVLVIRGANERGMPLSAANTANAVTGYSTDTSLTNGCIEGFCVGTIGVISNCQNGRFFRVGAISLTGNQVTLTHGGGWNMASNAAPSNNFITGSILPVHTIVYFVATRTGNPVPSLWQEVDGVKTEILPGVENISITYGCPADPSCGSTSFRTAANVPAAIWPKISSVHVEILVRGLEQNSTAEVQPYTFAGNTVTPNDRVLRQVFDATFAVRSRFN